jgi:hypothetical protein
MMDLQAGSSRAETYESVTKLVFANQHFMGKERVSMLCTYEWAYSKLHLEGVSYPYSHQSLISWADLYS